LQKKRAKCFTEEERGRFRKTWGDDFLPFANDVGQNLTAGTFSRFFRGSLHFKMIAPAGEESEVEVRRNFSSDRGQEKLFRREKP
jgi:hypothetical protein